jgi:hypothetical protein
LPALRAAAELNQAPRSDETIFRTDEAGLKQKSALMHLDQQRGSVMVGHIINLVYRGLCKRYLIAIRRRPNWA